jgi:2-dehydropantoate 2-reductase
VSKAAGITLIPLQGKDIVKLTDYHNPVKKKFSFMIIPLAIKKHAKLKASMLQDLEKGKKTEVDYINGIISDYGRKYQVPTPFNDTVVRIIHEIEVGKRKMGRVNLSEFQRQ